MKKFGKTLVNNISGGNIDNENIEKLNNIKDIKSEDEINEQIYLDNKEYFDKLIDVKVDNLEDLEKEIKENWGKGKKISLDHIMVGNILYTMDYAGSDKEIHWGNKRTYKGITFETPGSRYSSIDGKLNLEMVGKGEICDNSGFISNDINYAD